MSWLKIDDKLRTHSKWMAIDIYDRALWFDASVWSASYNTDGVIPEHMLVPISFSALVPADRLDVCVARLVKVGWWRRRRKADGGGWEIANWLEYQPSRAQVERKAETDSLHDWLHKSPQGKRVKAAVRRRDGIWCRYCGIECRTDGDRRSLARMTFDFIDPDFTFDRSVALDAHAFQEVVGAWAVACGHCNAVKNRRSPGDAEMPLRPAQGLHRIHSRSAAIQSRPDRESGTGRVGSGQDGSELDGTGQVGSTPSPTPAVEPELLVVDL
jgi:hypothetical protein